MQSAHLHTVSAREIPGPSEADQIPAVPSSATSSNRLAELEAEVDFYRSLFERLTGVCSQAAQGNLEARLLHCDQSEKSRSLARSVNHLLDMTDAFLREAGAALEHASEGKFFRRVLLRGMRGTFQHKSELINQAMEKMAGNSASLQEAERLIYDSARITQGAVQEAAEANSVVKQLGASSAKIDEVVKLISQIAWQTKLLAFNARIEATHAGDAGRGFEVVAQEVKNLAQQTASATDNISREISAIGGEVARTTQAIESISKTIGQMQEISAKIEHAVTDQKNRSGQKADPAVPRRN
jgi:methyl-accepting chemotaxis protein